MIIALHRLDGAINASFHSLDQMDEYRVQVGTKGVLVYGQLDEDGQFVVAQAMCLILETTNL
jgi:hypothetical protein